MLIMLSLGGSSKKIAGMVAKSVDNADFVSFQDVNDMITQSNLRRYNFSRLIFSAKFIDNSDDMAKLCDYVRDNMGRVEIVYILNPDQMENEAIFKEYFDSPLYTIMYIKTPTSKVMIEAVSLPIVDLKARYYMLDKPTTGNVKGTTKNVLKSQKAINTVQDSVDTAEQGVSALDGNGSFAFGNAGGNYQDDSELLGNAQNGVSPSSQNSNASAFGSSSHQDETFSDGNSFNFLSETDLSLGDFGSQHSDSGFVGDDELEELEKLANQSVETEPEIQQASEEVEEPVAEEIEEEVATQTNEPIVETSYEIAGVIAPGKVNIVLGVRGSNTAPYVLNTAISAKRAGKRVLVIDLDFISNRILSYINTKDFYAQGCAMGIAHKRVYNQGGVDFISNGYNSGVVKNIAEVLGSPITKYYDVVLVDCPCESLISMPDSIFGACNIVICCEPELSKLKEFTVALYNRNCVSLFKETYVAKCGKIANKGIAEEDVATLKNDMLFPNGCWLDNLQ